MGKRKSKQINFQNKIKINNKAIEKYEKIGNYKEAIRLYEINISKYNDENSKINLAKLYMNKTSGINNNYKARKLLEETYNKKFSQGDSLYAYMLLHGIGGKKDKELGYKILLDEFKLNNPDPIVYIELSKYAKKRNKNISIILKECYTKNEYFKYKSDILVDKFNNTIFGRIFTYIPNKIIKYFEPILTQIEENNLFENCEKLYERANECMDFSEYSIARRIYERLSNLDHDNSKIKYAQMCYNGIGEKKDIETAKKIYSELLLRKENKLNYLKNKINEKNKILNLLKEKKSYKNKIKLLENQIIDLENKMKNIIKYENYKKAEVNYGILLVENYKNKDDLEKGINILKMIASKGEKVNKENSKLNKTGLLNNKCARIAIKKLGDLYKEGVWVPDNNEETRKLFCKFSTGKISRYTSEISDQLKNIKKGKNINSDIISNKLKNNKKENIKNKKCNLRYEIGTLFQLFGNSKISRKIYESMHENGDFRADYSLARYEHFGKGGKKDYDKAKEHYRCYINSSFNITDKDELKIRRDAIKELGDLLLIEKDYIESIQLYKDSALMGNRKAKKQLKKLYEQGKWEPENKEELEYIKVRKIEKFVTKIKNYNNNFNDIKKYNKNKIYYEKKLKPAITSIALATSIAVNNNNNKFLINEIKKLENNYSVNEGIEER